MKDRMKKRNGRRSLARCFGARTDARGISRVSLIVIICWCLFNVSSALSLNGESAEYPVKLAVLYNFTKFVEWPADSYSYPSAPLAICVVGHDPFSPDMEKGLQIRKAGEHPIQVLTLKPSETLRTCHMVFIPVTEKDQAGKIVRSLKGSSILTVGEADGFAAMGGVINLTVENSGIHFEINRLAAERAHLKISVQLLSLAKIVTERDPGKKD
jgi:hypothetical protein